MYYEIYKRLFKLCKQMLFYYKYEKRADKKEWKKNVCLF